ncbi:MAG: hypothetical protein ABIZ34_09870 [Candidatus Limnocylindrales bacterium]
MAVAPSKPYRTRLAALAVSGIALASTAGPVFAADPSFVSSSPSMLTTLTAGSSATPLLTVGEYVGSYMFDALPDGISLNPGGSGRVIAYINHETSTVPFPYTPTTPTEANSQNDFSNARLSRIRLDTDSLDVQAARYVIKSSANYQRFCSNFLARGPQGFDRPTLFTNEEATDYVSRSGTAWQFGQVTTEPPNEQAGVVVAYDTRSRTYQTIYGMGRLNHENALALEGYGHPVIMTGDDTFTTDPAQSQVYMYQATDRAQLMADAGTLYGFKASTPGYDDYYDFGIGSTVSIAGNFIPMDPLASKGTQSALEADSDAKGVFQFLRIEDMAYDRTNHNIVYLADSGRAVSSDANNRFPSTNGRIWKMVLDPTDPTIVTSLSVFVEGEGRRLKDPTVIHQPDNLETTANSLLVLEDPSSGNQFSPSDTSSDSTTARVWMVNLSTGARTVVAKVDQSLDESSGDVDAAAKGNLGAWESTGIIDASKWFGPGAFLIAVQAHTLWIAKAPGPDDTGPTPGVPDGTPDFTYKREGGQLLLLRIPGA